MRVDGKSTRAIWLEPDGWSVCVIDQTALPHRFLTARLTTLAEAAHAIRTMVIRAFFGLVASIPSRRWMATELALDP